MGIFQDLYNRLTSGSNVQSPRNSGGSFGGAGAEGSWAASPSPTPTLVSAPQAERNTPTAAPRRTSTTTARAPAPSQQPVAVNKQVSPKQESPAKTLADQQPSKQFLNSFDKAFASPTTPVAAPVQAKSPNQEPSKEFLNDFDRTIGFANEFDRTIGFTNDFDKTLGFLNEFDKTFSRTGVKSPNEEDLPKAPTTVIGAKPNPQVGEGISAFNINNFRSSATIYDSVLPKHSFLVTFAPFAATQKAASVLNKYIAGTAAGKLVLRCDSAQLPGVTALKDEVTRFGYGPVEDMAYGVQFADMTLGFILDDVATHSKFFDEWMNLVTNFASKGGGGEMTNTNKNGYNPYEVGYKDDYSNLQMNITVFDRSQNQVLVYELYDVFPTSINAMDVAWADTDQLMRLYVRFAYTDYTLRVPKIDGYYPDNNWQFQNKTDAANKSVGPAEEIVVTARQQSGSYLANLGAPVGVGVIPQSQTTTATYISPDPNKPDQIIVTARPTISASTSGAVANLLTTKIPNRFDVP